MPWLGLLQVLPMGSFYGKTEIIMTDDSGVARRALSNIWPKATLLMCTFHFLQRRWTWLFDAKNKIKQSRHGIKAKPHKAS